jgi:energy-converting hydrogenase B subunit D
VTGPVLAVVTPYTTPLWLMDTLQVTVLVLVAAAAAGVVAIRNPVRQVVALSVYGLLLAALFLVFQAPDVTLSELSVGAVALPIMLLLALTKVKEQGRGEQGARDQGTGTRSAAEKAEGEPARRPHGTKERGT